MNHEEISLVFSKSINESDFPLKFRIKFSESENVKFIKDLIFSSLSINKALKNKEIEFIDLELKELSLEKKNHFSDQIIQLLCQNESDLRILSFIINEEISHEKFKSFYEKLENQNFRKKYILLMFFDQSYKEPRWFKNLFINLNIKIDHKLNTKNLENQSKDFFFLNEKNKIIDLILKKSSNLNLESKKTFVKKIEKIEKIFFETENFHLNQKYVLEYIRILLKDFA